jgi:hypothetical protein
MEVRESSVQHTRGVVDLAVAQDVDNGPPSRVALLVRAHAVSFVAAALAANGSALTIRSRARPSWLAETNQASYADGGR